MSAPNAGKSLTCEFSNYILVLQKRSIGSCEIKQLHGILFQKRSLESLHFLPTPNGAEMSEEREVNSPASHEKRKKRKTRAIWNSGSIRIESTTGVHVLR